MGTMTAKKIGVDMLITTIVAKT